LARKRKNDGDMNDELLMKHILDAQENNSANAFDFLLKYFEKDIKGIKAKNRLFVFGFDDDDIYQECRVVVHKAILKFDPSKAKNPNSTILDTFRHLIFKMCKSRMITLIQESKTHKKKALNQSESLDIMASDSDGNEYSYYDRIPSEAEKISTILERNQREQLIKEKVNSYLTDLEKSVFQLIYERYSYSEIAQKLSIDEKSVDNAIQRTRKKIETNKMPILLSADIDLNSEQIKKIFEKAKKKDKKNNKENKK
jgi:RNA polymerase sporulation-specific sigma factor